MFEEKNLLLPTDVFRLIRDFIRNYCGIYFDDKSKYIVEHRLNRRLKIHHMKDFRDYYRFLIYDRQRDEEVLAIIDILTVNETYFFRDQNQLAAFSEEIVPELNETLKDKRKLGIWSAGCSTGEEPYTIAMLLLENRAFRDWEITILGSDISRRVLQVAREGSYRKNSFRASKEYFIKTYFQEQQNGSFKLLDNVKRLVSFNSLNLFDPFKIKLIPEMDVIFCRNVLIYFDDNARKKVINSFYNILKDGGYLLLGHTESLMNITTDFKLKHLKNYMVYQKPIKA